MFLRWIQCPTSYWEKYLETCIVFMDPLILLLMNQSWSKDTWDFTENEMTTVIHLCSKWVMCTLDFKNRDESGKSYVSHLN